MMRMPADKFITPEVNLLPEEDLTGRPGGQFLQWALSWGKKIVILTELLVVLAFLSRFKFDSDIANNSDEIDRRKIIIVASADFENRFRQVNDQIQKVKTIINFTSPLAIYDQAKSLIPQGVTVSQIAAVGQNLGLQGSGDDASLAKMVAAFKESPNFTDVSLEKVSKEKTSNVDFSLTAQYLEKTR